MAAVRRDTCLQDLRNGVVTGYQPKCAIAFDLALGRAFAHKGANAESTGISGIVTLDPPPRQVSRFSQ